MAEEAEPDTASWVEVKVTSLFTAVTTAAFLIVFEIARRSPYLSSVFDRRRSTCSSRCPPPLVRRRILEWLFLSTDPDYRKYADLEHMKQVVEERRRQQLAAGMREDDFQDEPFSPTSKLDSIQEDDGDLEEGRPALSKTGTGLTTKSSNTVEGLESNSIRKKPRRNHSGVAHVLTPDVFVMDGRRLPMSVAEYAMSGDLTEAQLQKYEQKLLDKEYKEEQEFYKRQRQQEHMGFFSKLRYLGVRPRFEMSFTARCKSLLGKSPTPEEPVDLNKSSRTMASASSGSPESPNSPKSFISRISSGRSVLTSFLSNSPTNGLINRHLKSSAVTIKRPLGDGDRELLRCIGLDAYVMIRFLRFGFDCTFYPFVVACLTLLPTYITSDYEGGESDANTSEGYFQLTINALEPQSHRLWIPWGFALLYFCYVLRKVWIEWETFIVLRFDFLANGDVAASQIESKNSKYQQKDDVRLHLEQYRNSCMIEYVPESHRRDKELFEFFDAVFPDQVKRAEILLNAKSLTKLIKERQHYIEEYENVTARYYHAKQVYRRHEEDMKHSRGLLSCLCCCFCGGAPEQPQEPMIPLGRRSVCCCGNRKMVKALPHYLSEIKRLNGEIEEEHRRIMVEKQKSEDKEESHNLFTIGLKQGLKYVVGAGSEFTCATGFVEFKNLTAKQTAIQCNISGTNNFMVTKPAPDPRDMVWDNSTVEHATIRVKKMQCDALLFTAALFWSVVVTFITSISNLDRLENILPSWLIPEEDSFWYGLIQGYLPVLFLEFFMLFVPVVLRIIANSYIRFKTNSEVDQFVFLWHFVYRVCNLLIIMISGSIFATIKDIQTSPSAVITQVASNIAQSSQFFLNNMIFAAGTENSWELAQMYKMFMHFVTYRIVTVEAKSKRALEKMDKPESFEWGEVVPPFIFAFLVAAVYCAMVPVLLGACAIFFYIASKVYVHQAVYVYAQPYEGGGKLMYMMNRTVFVIIYISIIIFSTVLGLRQAPAQAPSFFFIMTIITFLVDRKVSQTFVKPSLTLALTNARIIDEENTKLEERARRYKEYKASKMEKQLKEKKGAKNISRLPSLEEEGETMVAAVPVEEETPERKRISFSDSEESPKELLRQRQGSDLLKSTPSNGSDNSNSGDGGKYDFFLYRQPILNKSLWETKPRPYR